MQKSSQKSAPVAGSMKLSKLQQKYCNTTTYLKNKQELGYARTVSVINHPCTEFQENTFFFTSHNPDNEF